MTDVSSPLAKSFFCNLMVSMHAVNAYNKNTIAMLKEPISLSILLTYAESVIKNSSLIPDGGYFSDNTKNSGSKDPFYEGER